MIRRSLVRVSLIRNEFQELQRRPTVAQVLTALHTNLISNLLPSSTLLRLGSGLTKLIVSLTVWLQTLIYSVELKFAPKVAISVVSSVRLPLPFIGPTLQ